MRFTGRLEELSLAEIFKNLEAGGSSGVLDARSPDFQARLHIKEGRVSFASSPQCGRLGDALVQLGLVSDAERESLLRVQRRKRTHQPLAGIAAELGLVAPEALAEAIRTHTARILRTLSLVREGEVSFEPGDVDETGAVRPEGLQLGRMLALTSLRACGRVS
jgi:hypothetical protein